MPPSEPSQKVKPFKVISCLTAALYTYLFFILLCAPNSLLKSVGVAGNESAFFLARRASMLMLGFAVLTFGVRNSPSSITRQAISISISVCMAGLSVLSGFEYFRGFASKGILPPCAIELVFAVVYFLIWLFNRNRLTPAA